MPGHKKKILFGLLLALLLYAAAEAGIAFALRHSRLSADLSNFLSTQQKETVGRIVRGEERFAQFHPRLGWTNKPHARDGLNTSNAQGLRGEREYGPRPAPGVTRIACFGDSFTFGIEVGFEDTWEERLGAANPQMEVLNFGVGGYGADQAFLRYREEAAAFHPDVVFIGFQSENIYRHVNAFRPFYNRSTNEPLSKPRFVWRDGALTLIPNPIASRDAYRDLLDHPEIALARLGQNDFYYRRMWSPRPDSLLPSIDLWRALHDKRAGMLNTTDMYAPNGEAFPLTRELLAEFHDTVRRDGARPVILFFPSKDDMHKELGGQRRPYRALFEAIETRGLETIDLFEALGPQGTTQEQCDALFLNDHYSPLGNQLVAARLAKTQ